MSHGTAALEATVKDYILKEFLPGEDPAGLTFTTPLLTTGILDSLATLNLIAFLERQYQITVEAHDAKPSNLNTIAQIASLVRAKLGA
jgi:acyl carrier protein